MTVKVNVYIAQIEIVKTNYSIVALISLGIKSCVCTLAGQSNY